MIEMYVEQDIGSYQTKFIGPFTLRQTICLLIGAPLCWTMYRYLSPVLSRDLTGFLIAIPAFFFTAVGWYRPYGMKTEQYLKAVFVCRYLYPRMLKYKTANCYDLEHGRDKPKKNKYKPKEKKAKYRVSPEAVR